MTKRPALDEYVGPAELKEPKAAIFQSVDPAGRLTGADVAAASGPGP